MSRRNALVGVLDKPSEFAGRAVHEWTAQVFREVDGPILSGQYRLMIRTERTKAREKKKYDDIESSGPTPTRRSTPSKRSTPPRSGAAPSRAGGRTWPRGTRSGPW